jgi:hypothetical protein
MFSLLSRLFRSDKASSREPRPRPPRYSARRDARVQSALLDVLGWQPPVPVNREALLKRGPRIP